MTTPDMVPRSRDTCTNLARSLDRRSLREFALRVAFQMGAEDSSNLIDSPPASKLGLHRALFYDEEAARLDKSRCWPWRMPLAGTSLPHTGGTENHAICASISCLASRLVVQSSHVTVAILGVGLPVLGRAPTMGQSRSSRHGLAMPDCPSEGTRATTLAALPWERVVLGIRPSALLPGRPAGAADTLTGLVQDVEPLVGETVVTLKLGSFTHLSAVLQEVDEGLRPGQPFTVGVDLDQVCLFDPETEQVLCPQA